MQVGQPLDGPCGIDRDRSLNVINMRCARFFAAHPDLFEEMIKANFVIRGGPHSRLRGVENQMAMGELDAAVGLPGDIRVVRDHQDGVARVVQLAEDLEHNRFIRFVKVAGGLVGENQLRLIDESARDGHALLFAARKLGREMRQAVAEPHAAQGFGGLLLVGDAMEILRKHDVF